MLYLCQPHSQVNAVDLLEYNTTGLAQFPKTVTHFHNSLLVSSIANPPQTAPVRKLEPLLIGPMKKPLGQ